MSLAKKRRARKSNDDERFWDCVGPSTKKWPKEMRDAWEEYLKDKMAKYDTFKVMPGCFEAGWLAALRAFHEKIEREYAQPFVQSPDGKLTVCNRIEMVPINPNMPMITNANISFVRGR